MTGLRRACLLVAAGLLASACVTARPVPIVTTPRYPDYPMPEIPTALAVGADVRSRQDTAWQRLQGGDLPGARGDFEALLARSPGLYPARTGLGFVDLAAGQHASALEAFDAALSASEDYLPAWIGRADVLLALERDADAVTAMERILEIDPGRDRTRARLELVRFRAVQRPIAGGQAARDEGRLDEARGQLTRALSLSPASSIILQELVAVEHAAGRLDEAERFAREAVAAAPRDADAQAALGGVLADQGRYAGAADAYDQALAIDPRPEWRDRVSVLRIRADLAAVPGLDSLVEAPEVTRAQVAAYLAIRLGDLLRQAPVRITEIATDIRGHWAASWILPVTRAGVMAVYPNHTFQPDAVVSRGDLATIISELLRLAASGQPALLATWESARPRFSDLPETNVRYEAVALAVAAGALPAADGGAFRLAGAATGRDLFDAVGRVADLASR